MVLLKESVPNGQHTSFVCSVFSTEVIVCRQDVFNAMGTRRKDAKTIHVLEPYLCMRSWTFHCLFPNDVVGRRPCEVCFLMWGFWGMKDACICACACLYSVFHGWIDPQKCLSGTKIFPAVLLPTGVYNSVLEVGEAHSSAVKFVECILRWKPDFSAS